MKKISLVRTFLADPEIYILEGPFNLLDKNTAKAVEKRLREKQKEGKTVIMTETTLDSA
jgi:ABC-type multidrug transport system ATPase subunit